MGGESFLGSSRLFFATSAPTKRRTHYFCFLFSQYWVGVEKNNVLHTSPRNQSRDYFIWNRIEKLMPQLWNFSPQTKNLKQTDQLVFKPWFVGEIWVSQNPGFVPGSPPGGLYFQKWPPQKIFPDNIGQTSKSSFFKKMASFCRWFPS